MSSVYRYFTPGAVSTAAVAAVSQPGYARERKIHRGIILRLVVIVGILLAKGVK